MKKIKRFLQTFFICFAFISSAYSQKVNGRVTDNSGNAIEGASILVKTTKAGTTTDASGNFSVPAKQGDVLLITALGFGLQQVTVSGDAMLTIVMKSQATELDQIVLLGSRSGGRVKTESPVPVDVINLGNANLTTARPDLTSILNYAAPSFNYNKQSGGDGADHVDLATLRGLGPDQTLVLVNGKRWHQTAFVALFGTRGRGNSGTDLNAIPESAIDRVEILRDGASAQYGSDAIAGVINLVLKKDVEKWQINIGGSGYYDKKYNPHFGNSFIKSQYEYGNAIDGEALSVGINRGFAIGKSQKGFINLSGNFFTQGKTYRQVLDTNVNHKDGLPVNVGRRANGDASVNSGGAMYNMEAPLAGTKTTFYSFGEYNYKSTDAFAYTRTFHGFNGLSSPKPARFPTDANGNLIWDPSIMKSIPTPGDLPDTTFNPHEQTHITDASAAVGFRGTTSNDWEWDLSNTLGKNDFHYFGDKTFNASLGAAGVNKNHFDDGGFSFLQNTVNLDFSKKYSTVASGFNLSFGAEYRFEQYKIYAGEKDSYFNYDVVTPKAAGSQGFPGFQPADVVNAKRSVEGLYVQGDLDITTKWLTTGAIRLENYSDFGFLSTYKFATRYKLTKNFNIRGSVSTGYRAPSLQQINFSNTFTNVQGGKSFDVKIAPNFSPITKAAGIPTLKQEKSVNVSLGFTVKPSNEFTITVDGYLVNIKNRVVLSGQFDTSNVALKPILQQLDVSQAQFFANAVNTTNTGVDIILNYAKNFGSKNLNVLLAANFQHMKIDKVNVPAALNGSFDEQQAFFSDREQKFVLASAPPEKIGLTIDYGSKLKVGTHLTYFGKIVLYGYGWDQPYPPLVTLDNGSQVLEQLNYNGKLVTDIYASYKLAKSTTLYIGADNLFNVHPDLGYVPGAKSAAYDGEAGGPWDAVQMGTNGIRLFAKFSFNF